MNTVEKNIVKRVLFCILSVSMTAGAITLATVLGSDASYTAPITPNETSPVEEEDVPLSASSMPEDAYAPVYLTFGGSCTVGSMLGSDSYGTFNALLSESGEAYFLDRMCDLFDNDDFTFVLCNTVLSDNDLSPAERGTTEWYRAPSNAARIFGEGGVEAVALHAFHTWDYGETGYSDTKAALESADILWGDHGKALYYEKNDISIALYERYVDDETDAEGVLAWLSSTGAAHDYTAVYIVLPEDENTMSAKARRDILRSFAEGGADVVVATDTVRVGRVEEWGDSLIVYSLGALLDGRTKYPEQYTLVLGVELKTLDGELNGVEYTLTPCRTYDASAAWCPFPVTDEGELSLVTDYLYGRSDTLGERGE